MTASTTRRVRDGSTRRAGALSALLILSAGLGAGAATPGLAADAADRGAEYRFGVYYDDRRIGEHRWQIAQRNGLTRVASRARFEVKVLFVPVYRYRHAANELWQDGCLETVAAVTNDNGREQRVKGASEPAPQLASFADTEATTRVALAGDCAGSFAYWNVEYLERPTLINVQTGERVAATLVRQGETTYMDEPAIRYELQAGDLPVIELWYRRADQQWLGLATERDGARLAYRLESRTALPAVELDPGEALPAPSI